MGRVARTVAGAAAALALSAGLAAAQTAQEPAPGRIRVSVDVIAVDVQVIDRAGHPVPDLGPDKFTVTINGRRRRIVSAEQIGSDTPGGTAPVLGAASPIRGRVIMLAVDSISFEPTASRDVIDSVAQFVRGLQPDDYVGVSIYPNGAEIAPTMDHAAVLRALSTVVGQRDGPGIAQFNLRPTEIIDISRDIAMGDGPTLRAVIARECGGDPGPVCRYNIVSEVTNTALYYEGQATASLGMLRTLLRQMRDYPGRKTLVLVSGGMLASDTPGGRPDLGSLGIQVGKEAAIANAAVYTLFIDSSLHDRFAAETRRGDRTSDTRVRDATVVARWLEQFTGSAGGALFPVLVGNAASSLERIRNELTSYYLLGVEPAEEDRDGRTHEVAVKLTQPNLTIRGRRWVMIPRRGMSASVVTKAAPVPTAVSAPNTAAAPAPAAPLPPRRAVPDDVQALADVFERGSGDALQQAMGGSRDLPNVLRGFRASESPWPSNPRLSAIFALELARAGLRSGNRDARDEAGRVLAEYHVRIRGPQGPDEFECAWLATEAAALQGLFMPDTALLFIPRGVQRCPGNPRLALAYAFAAEQQWLRGLGAPGQEAEILTRYDAAMAFPDTAGEARVRAARFLHALGQHERGLATLDGITTRPADLEVRYFVHLTRGQLLQALGRTSDAAVAFRAALEAWPGAQSARVALMTMFATTGQRAEAAALAEEIQTAPADQFDPWWTYWIGDYRSYGARLARLRELGR